MGVFAANTDVPHPTRRCRRPCVTCPFRPELTFPRDVMVDVAHRIARGERWVCHSTTKGIHIVETSMLCALAPNPGEA